MKFRAERMSKLIREELAGIIIREVSFGNALVTITEVNIEKKLDYARVLVSVIPSSAADRALETLHAATPHLQHLVWKKINLRPMPKIAFVLDHGPENAASVEKIALDE